MNSNTFTISLLFTLLFAIAIPRSTNAQGDPAKGWVQLWNGKNWDGLTMHVRGQKSLVSDMNNQDKFFMEDGIIRTQTGSKGNAHLYTIKAYSYYHVRIHYKFVTTQAGSNAGLIVHANLDQIPELSGDNRPSSIEVNMKRANNSPWSLWSASKLGPYFTSTVSKNGSTDYLSAKDGGVEWTNDPWGSRILYSSYENPEYPPATIWNVGEVIMEGDKATFILNGQERTKAWDFKMRNPNDPGDASPENMVPYTEGSIGLQYEIEGVIYKNWEIRSLIGCMDPKAKNYGDWYVKDSIPTACTY